jgi:hypothetical protein
MFAIGMDLLLHRKDNTSHGLAVSFNWGSGKARAAEMSIETQLKQLTTY